MRESIHLQPAPSADALDLAVTPGCKARVIGIEDGSLTTLSLELDPKDAGSKVARLGVVERHKKTGRVGLGWVSGFGLERGAFASTVGHDAHNIMVVGSAMDHGPAAMKVAIDRLHDLGGGQVVVDENGQILEELPLPIGGLMSDRPAEEVGEHLERLVVAAQQLGVKIRAPFMHLSFLGLSVIPELRLTDKGLVDVGKFELVDVEISQ